MSYSSPSAATQNVDPEPAKRSVVSHCFLLRLDGTPDGQPQVARFWLSAHMSTHSISGTVKPTDTSPLAVAWREITEQTSLAASSFSLFRRGKPCTTSDPPSGRSWVIHPFAFILTSPAAAESQSRIPIAWGPASSITNEAPFLRVCFENVVGPAAGAVLAAGLRSLSTDYVSGARQMAGSALRIFRGTVADLTPCAPTEEWWSTVRTVAWHLVQNGRGSMSAAIQSALLAALVDIEKLMANHPEGEPFLPAVTRCIDNTLARRDQAATKLSTHLTDFLTSHLASDSTGTSRPHLSILTLSESSTTLHALLHLVQTQSLTTLAIHILESRPLFEGVSLAAALVSGISSMPAAAAADGTKVTITLHTDASAAQAARSGGVDVVLLGADRIGPRGDVLNKTGSLPAVLSARYYDAALRSASVDGSGRDKVKVIVLSDTEKLTPSDDASSHVAEDNGGEQVARAWQSAEASQRLRDAAAVVLSRDGDQQVEVEIRNVFFEWVPADLVDAYITELGRWDLNDIREHTDQLRKVEERMFGGL